MKEDFLLSSYNYNLPTEQIAQTPSSQREESRLLVLHRKSGATEHLRFSDIVHFLKPGDCMVINRSKVFPARIMGTKPTGGRIEFLLLELPVEKSQGLGVARALCRSSKPVKPGQTFCFAGIVEITVERRHENGQMDISLHYPQNFRGGILGVLKKVGTMPLPPYIKRKGQKELDRERYQTVYARDVGSVAAPTAGLHFSNRILSQIEAVGVEIAPITLHVGYGTFSPIRTRDIRSHHIHSEWISIDAKAARKIERAKKSGGKIIAVGTTSVRTVEFVFREKGKICAFSGRCGLYIYPGFRFALTDSIVTNFHLPKSSLLVLVSAFAGREKVLETYMEAVATGYRFFSYGDAMLIV